jgi:chemotaxis protein MotA
LIGREDRELEIELPSEVSVLRDLIFPAAVLLALIAALTAKPQFFDPLSLLFTCGGALAVVGFSYSRKQLRDCVRAVFNLFTQPQGDLQECAAELRRLTGAFRLQGLRGMESWEKHLTDPYLKYGVELLLDLRNAESIRACMEQRFTEVLGEHEINRQILSTLGKLLPSFGLIGTLIGMVLLLGNLSNQDSESLPGALGLAVLTTLYGAVSANLVVAPLLSRLHAVAAEQEMKMRLTREWVLVFARGNGAAVPEMLNALPAGGETPAPRKHQWTTLSAMLAR